MNLLLSRKQLYNLQYTLLLLIPYKKWNRKSRRWNLQYTLLLLIPCWITWQFRFRNIFTIHFATINTVDYATGEFLDDIFTIHFATINTKCHQALSYPCALFTIHFATINTRLCHFSDKNITYLQYTLLLLIRSSQFHYKQKWKIYNTLCYY